MASGFFLILLFVDKLGKWEEEVGECLLMSPNSAEELVSEEKHLDVFKILLINYSPASPALLMFNYFMWWFGLHEACSRGILTQAVLLLHRIIISLFSSNLFTLAMLLLAEISPERPLFLFPCSW